ncbi:hypothetical protein BBJ28_00004599 [Nothophytophthora sp. Chile5]|nr:hypothetical protein BBJ28_00004599 [Nothophytophthora sp. Chile5]
MDFTNNSAPQGSTKIQNNSTARAKTPNGGMTSISSWVSRSNLSSFFAQANIPVPDDPAVHVHHPMVRKKYPIKRDETFVENANEVLSSPSVQQPIAESVGGKSLKRKRDWVADLTANEFAKTPVEKRKRLAVVESTPFTSPSPSDKRTRPGVMSDVAFQTPQQISRKKFYIKMRMVPLDKQTKSNVVRCGCRPKVELKLSSTKKISEVAAHMSKKWAKVLPILPAGAALRFFQKNRTIDSVLGSSGWSKEDSGVTCFDIWKQCGKQSKGENVVEISYLWKAPESPTPSYPAGDSGLQKLMPLQAPPGLFEREVATATQQTIEDARDETELKQTSPVHGLQEFGEKVAFDRSISVASEKDAALLTDVGSAGDDAVSLAALIGDYVDDDLGEEYSPNTGRLRRRIKPTLVATEEFNI